MTIAIVQSAVSEISVFTPEHTIHTLSWDVSPSPGNTLVAFLSRYDDVIGGTGLINNPSGWTQRADEQTATGAARTIRVLTKVAAASEPAVSFTFDATRRTILAIVEVAGSFAGVASGTGASATSHSLATAAPTAGVDVLMLSAIVHGNAQSVTTHPSGWTILESVIADDGASEWLNLYYRQEASPSGTYGGTLVLGAVAVTTKAALWFIGGAPIADFSASPTTAPLGVGVAFEDLSSGSPTSWAWTFGDGDTSTLQDPAHVYAAPGTYSVSLTATNAIGADTETKTSYITITTADVPDPVLPAGVLLEIFAADPGGARWDVAKWDEAVWATAGWQDVTPYGIHVNIAWGSNRPELGILSVPEAASWAVDYYDPDRVLDPANEDGPYYGDLQPYLPIRVSHRGTIVRVGYVTGISHNYAPPDGDGDSIGGFGCMRGADNISRLANAQVPSDTELADTLYARAVDAIAAAGLSVSVATPIGTDPPVSPWITGTREWSVWEWIKDAAQEVLHIPIVDRYGTVTFRPWASPLTRARSLASPELVDLAVVSDYSGLFSVIQAREDVDTLVERALTPPPRYGARTYTRDEITIDPGGWADAVLADRALPALLWKPGWVRPLTAVSTEQLATIEAIERIGLTLTEQTPPIIAAGIVVGGEIDIRGKQEDEAVWRFRYELAQTATEPLIETGGDPTDYLLRTGGGEYLYPTGGA